MPEYITAQIQFKGQQWAVMKYEGDHEGGVPHYRRVRSFVSIDDALRFLDELEGRSQAPHGTGCTALAE